MNRRTGRADGHTEWWARDHRCNLAEHRADDIVISIPGHGRALLTRVRADDGRDHAEIRIRLALSPVEGMARRQLSSLLTGIHTLVGDVVRRPRRAA